MPRQFTFTDQNISEADIQIIKHQLVVFFWMRTVIPLFLAITACFSGVITIIKRDHLSKRYLFLSIIGIILSGAFLLLAGFLWLVFQD